MFGWFSKKVEIEMRDENGNLKKVKVREKDFDRWVAEGKVQKVGDGCQVHILDPKGNRTENWVVGRDIDQYVYERMKDAQGDIYALVVYRRGEAEVNVVPKEIWDQAKVAISNIQPTAMSEVPYKKWDQSIDELAQGFRGRRFGELILHHVKRQTFSNVTDGLNGTVGFLPPELQRATEEWIDVNNAYATSAAFWQSDCADVLLSIVEHGEKFAASRGVAADEDTLLNLFQIIALNFAYTLHSEPKSKAFVQKALGMGFFRRLVG